MFDPKLSISPPYYKCPKCNKSDSFGVLWIARNSYTRRCPECWHTVSYKLPQLNKIIIYLDQFVISEMMKAINKKLRKAESINRFWLALFERIDRLIKLQLIICPNSSFHQNESAFYQFQAHKRMYEHLSNGSSFNDPGTIKRFQISDYFRQLVQGVEKPESKIERTHIIRGHYNDWQERIPISINFDIKEEELDQLKSTKAKVNEALSQSFAAWKTEKSKKFSEWFVEEAMAFGRELVRQHFENLSKLFYLSVGKLVLRLANILTKSFNLFQYRIGGGGPYERPGVGIGVLDEMVDLADQVFHASEGAPADGLLSDNIEPYLHLVQPGSIGRRKMNLKARMNGQPALNPRMLMGAIVVDHQMDG